MVEIESNGLHYLQFELLPADRVAHGVFTRSGGVSQPPWTSLNVGSTVGDDPQAVNENRRRLFQALGRSPESSFDLWQVHAARVVRASEPRHGPPYPKADGVVTDSTDVTLWMRFADCVPILIYDPVRPAVGMAHAGWKGTVRQVVSALIHRMQVDFGSEPSDLRAAIGPAVAGHHYPVGADVVDALHGQWGDDAAPFLRWEEGTAHLDLAGANTHLLREAGVADIERADICTMCNLSDWFSHRGEHGQTGRFGAAIALRADAGE
ncbi:MAG: peptidoglycan editing factor PgeF [Anaerolineales bacterium]